MRSPSPGRARGFWRDAAGVSALEFALVAPFLILFLLGVSDFVPSFVARFKAAHANGSFGDLVTQSSALRDQDIAADYTAAADVMTPYDSSNLYLRVTSVYSDGKGKAFVYWSCGQGTLPPYTARSQVNTTPTGVAVSSMLYLGSPLVPSIKPLPDGTNTSYVMTESTYSYTAPAQFVLVGPQTMTSVVYLYPRQSPYIGFHWDGDANDPPPKPTATKKAATLTLSNGARCSYAV